MNPARSPRSKFLRSDGPETTSTFSIRISSTARLLTTCIRCQDNKCAWTSGNTPFFANGPIELVEQLVHLNGDKLLAPIGARAPTARATIVNERPYFATEPPVSRTHIRHPVTSAERVS